ncbi:TlpA family protein disulfide reductase [Thiocapsa sp.]|uniref:TlpA family protein disulfide reductase n=1 Tax=Thiocapsa sp. TaxID=2024551 RepID=UPI0035933E20
MINLIERSLLAAALLCCMPLVQAQTLPQPTGDAHAPACELSALNGKVISDWSEFSGKVVYVDFWASWCLPCLRTFPFMMELAAEMGMSGLQIVAVNLDEDRSAAQAFLLDFELQDYSAGIVAVADDSRECAKAFEVVAMPSSYLIDRRGVIRYQHKGFRPADEHVLRQRINNLLNE